MSYAEGLRIHCGSCGLAGSEGSRSVCTRNCETEKPSECMMDSYLSRGKAGDKDDL